MIHGGTNNLFFLLDSHNQNKPLQNANGRGAPPARRGSDVDSIAKTSQLSATAPEFVPTGMSQYDVSTVCTLAVDVVVLLILFLVQLFFNYSFIKMIQFFPLISAVGPNFL